MAGVGEKRLVRHQQAVGAVGGGVEAGGHGGDLVTAVHRRATGEVAGAPGLDAEPQGLEPSRDACDDGPGRETHHRGHREQHAEAVEGESADPVEAQARARHHRPTRHRSDAKEVPDHRAQNRDKDEAAQEGWIDLPEEAAARRVGHGQL